MNVELPRLTYISSWDNVKHFFPPAVPSSQLGRQSFKKARKPSPFGNGKWELRCWASDPESFSLKNINKDELFFNGSWEILPGQPGNAAAEGWPARFLYERWEMGNGKRAMAHRPVTMDHRKV